MVSLHDPNLNARFAVHLIPIGKGEFLDLGRQGEGLRDPKIAEFSEVDIELSAGPREDFLVQVYAL